MKVRAKELGYYNHKRRREGVEFDLVEKKGLVNGVEKTITVEDQFSDKWMERLAGSEPVKKAGRPAGRGPKSSD